MLYEVLGLSFVVFCLILVYYYVSAKRKLNEIVLIEKREGYKKNIESLSNPLLSFPQLIYQTAFQKRTDFERFLELLNKKPVPFKSFVCMYYYLFRSIPVTITRIKNC
mmetsp:Transcript_17664/g.27306  ORF Transcript_17664/g.27306 Transcript_17664/m.27306 type:complete len:108 (-) Transcript_17664:1391-1714(-)